MQKKYLSPEYLSKSQEYHGMRKELNDILRKKTVERTESEKIRVVELQQSMKQNAQEQSELLKEHLTKVSSRILSGGFRFNLTSTP